MREIKFRAWNGEKMSSPFVVGHMQITFDDYSSFYSLPNNPQWPIMQYTGLKDKNGVEIYESDVVRCVNGHIGLIEWEEHDCCFNVTDYYNSSNDYPSMAFIEGQPFEVIGNIYENGDLLNAE